MRVLVLTNGTEYYRFIDSVARKHGNLGEDYFIHHYKKMDFNRMSGYDIGISFMYQHKVPAEQVNTHTWINFHPGPLPEYKGRNLCYHAIMNGEKEFGATVHYMDENFDTGDIIEVGTFPIFPKWTAEDLSYWTIAASKNLFVEYFPRILVGEEFERKPNVGGEYYKKEPIGDLVYEGSGNFKKQVRAVYFPPHYPKIEIGGVTYKIMKDE